MQFFNRIINILFLLLLLFNNLSAQTNWETFISEGYIDFEESSAEELQALYEQYIEDPLYWETATIAEIRNLPLNIFLKEILIGIKERTKKYSDWGNFAKDAGFSKKELEAISLFIRLIPLETGTGKIYSYTAIKKAESRANITKNLSRGRYEYPSGWFIGGVSERDQDEPEVWDYANLTFSSPKIKQRLKIIGGAYRLNWGHSIIFSSSQMGLRSSRAINNIKAGTARFSNFTSTEENKYLFGAAAEIQTGSWQWRPFYSNHYLDANIEEGMASGIKSGGTHISAAQLHDKNSLLEKVYGLSSVYCIKNLEIGGLVFANSYSHCLEKINSGKSLKGASIFHRLHHKIYTLSGEICTLNPGDFSLIQTGIMHFDNIYIGISGRYFSPDFYTPLGCPKKKFSGSPSNEKGFYFGLEARLKNRWRISSYLDFFSEVVSSEPAEAITKGTETMLSATRNYSYIGVDIKVKRILLCQANSANPLQKKMQFKLKVNYKIFEDIKITGRYSHVRLSGIESETGSAVSIYGDYQIKSQSKLTAGITNFYSPSFDSRIYMYEPGIPLRFNMVSLSGTGYRYFICGRKKINEILEINFSGKLQYKKNLDQMYWNKTMIYEFQMIVDL